MSLETFFLSLKLDSYSYSVEDLVLQLNKELEESFKVKLRGEHIQNNQLHNWFFSHDLLEQKLLAIAEMKVVYRFKNLEIDIKRLLEASYNASTKDLFKWDNIRDYLKTKNIILSSISGYNEVNELREVNNLIKHSDSLKKLKIKIIEFKDLERLKHVELLSFYNRVAHFCDEFIISLAENIFNDLYFFDDTKLDKIAEELALRMTKNESLTLIKKLKLKY